MKKIISFAIVVFFSSFVFADSTVTLDGQCSVSHAPEYVQLDIQVRSVCNEKPQQAVAQADAIVSEIVGFLKSKIVKENDNNCVHTNGGYTNTYSHWYYSDDKKVEKCIGTFQKGTQITFKTDDLEHFAAIFAEIQEEVYGKFTVGSPSGDLEEKSLTYVTMGSPSPRVTEKTEKIMELKAITKARDNAFAQLEALYTNCHIRGYSIISASEFSPSFGGYSRGNVGVRDSYSESAGSSKIVPINFDDLSVSGTMYFEFNVEGDDCVRTYSQHGSFN